jgi:hypothetical protein
MVIARTKKPLEEFVSLSVKNMFVMPAKAGIQKLSGFTMACPGFPLTRE